MSIIGYELSSIENLQPQRFTRGPVRADTEGSSINVSAEVFLISIFIFFSLFAWFEFIRIAYDAVFLIENDEGYRIAFARFMYAIFISCFCAILSIIVYGIFNWSPTIVNSKC